jgi:Ca-activated chloride channel family protein
MSGFPLDAAKELMKNLVSNLRETDTFNLILFSGTSYQMASRSLPATRENISKAVTLISEQNGAGGTELSGALKDALAIPQDEDSARNIVVITDGYISGESEIFELINQHLDQADFFSFGIGSSVNRSLMEGIAGIGMGEAFIVTEEAEAEETAERFRTYVEAPILTDIQVSFEGFDAYDTEPSSVPTLFASRPVVLFGKWRGEPGGSIRISGKAGNEEYTQEIQVSGTEPSAEHEAIRYLWARKKVEALTACGFATEDEETREEITAIGLAHSMVTPYTSFVAVLDEVRNPEGESMDVDQPSPLPQGVSGYAVGGYLFGAEPEDLVLAVLAVLAVVTGVCGRRRRKRWL